MQIIAYRSVTDAPGLEFLAVIVHGLDFHPVTPFRSSESAEDAAAKAPAWWDAETAKYAATEAGKAARAAAVSAAARKRAKGKSADEEPPESF